MGWLSALFRGLSKSAVKSAARKAAPKIAKTVAKNALAGATQFGTNAIMNSAFGGNGRLRRRRRRRRRWGSSLVIREMYIQLLTHEAIKVICHDFKSLYSLNVGKCVALLI